MKITKQQLRQIIKEELEQIAEGSNFDDQTGAPLTMKGFAISANTPDHPWHEKSKSWLAAYHIYPKLKPIMDSLSSESETDPSWKEAYDTFNEFYMQFLDLYKRAQSNVGATSLSMSRAARE
tara:strand:+ start:119 stop:484 length:366 start_codon:yes stop_codon:yes gene_type:complete